MISLHGPAYGGSACAFQGVGRSSRNLWGTWSISDETVAAAVAEDGKEARMIIGNEVQAAELLAPFFAFGEGETVAVLHLDAEQRLIALTIERGGGDEVELPIRSILTNALRLGACAIVVAHNHPAGDPTPSIADEAATRALSAAAGGVDIRLYDHLIFGGSERRSFRLLGLL